MFDDHTPDAHDGDEPVTPTPSDRVRMLQEQPAGSGLLAGLQQVDATALSADEALTYLQQAGRAVSYVNGLHAQIRRQVADVVVAHFEAESSDLGRRAFVDAELCASAEIAAATRLSPVSSDARIRESRDLSGPWRPLLDSLLVGEVGLEHVRAIARELRKAPGYDDVTQAARYAKCCRTILKQVLPFARTHTPGQAANRAALLVVAADPQAARERRREIAENDHDVHLRPGDEPGTSVLTAVLPTAHGQALMSAVTTLASDDRFEAADGCVTRGQRRVAALVTLTLGDPGSVGRVDGPVTEAKLTAHVNVVVPLRSVLAGDVDAAQGGRIGNVVVSADVLRDVVAQCGRSTTLRRIVIDADGVILDAGRSHYLGSHLQKLVVRLRDGHCRFPGCHATAWRGDVEVDHARSWICGGLTDLLNLGVLCKKHHQLKTFGGWYLEPTTPAGDGTWRSPLGRVYEHEPPPLLPPPAAVIVDDPPPF